MIWLFKIENINYASVLELADRHVWGACVVTRMGSNPITRTIEQSILTFVRFKHIVSTSKEVDFLHLMKERIDLDD